MIDSKYILYIGTSPDGRGGLATVLREYRNFIGDSFKYVCTHADGSPLRKIALVVIAIFRTLYYFCFASIKVVHIHSASHLSFYRKSLFVFIAKLFRKQVVLHLHGGFFIDFAQKNAKYCQFIFDHSDLVITVSDYLRLNLQSILKHSNIQTVYNPIKFPNKINPISSSYQPKVQVVFFGTINENKGILDVVRCVEIFQSYFRERIELHIAGVGHLTEHLKQFISNQALEDFVLFHGWVEGEHKIQLLQDADIYLQPSYFESLGIAVLEAMSYETAVIASNRGGLPEIVHDHETGLLIEPGKPEELFEAMKCLIENVSLRETFAKRGVRIAEQAYLPNIMNQLDTLYSAL